MKRRFTPLIVLCALSGAVLAVPPVSSATVMTSNGASYTGAIRMVNKAEEKIKLDPSGTECDLLFEAQVETHPAFVASKWGVEELGFTNCGESITVTTNAAGTAYVGAAGVSALMSLIGTTITVVNHVLGTSCSYVGGNNALALMRSSSYTEGTATGFFNGRLGYESGGALCASL